MDFTMPIDTTRSLPPFNVAGRCPFRSFTSIPTSVSLVLDSIPYIRRLVSNVCHLIIEDRFQKRHATRWIYFLRNTRNSALINLHYPRNFGARIFPDSVSPFMSLGSEVAPRLLQCCLHISISPAQHYPQTVIRFCTRTGMTGTSRTVGKRRLRRQLYYRHRRTNTTQ